MGLGSKINVHEEWLSKTALEVNARPMDSKGLQTGRNPKFNLVEDRII